VLDGTTCGNEQKARDAAAGQMDRTCEVSPTGVYSPGADPHQLWTHRSALARATHTGAAECLLHPTASLVHGGSMERSIWIGAPARPFDMPGSQVASRQRAMGCSQPLWWSLRKRFTVGLAKWCEAARPQSGCWPYFGWRSAVTRGDCDRPVLEPGLECATRGRRFSETLRWLAAAGDGSRLDQSKGNRSSAHMRGLRLIFSDSHVSPQLPIGGVVELLSGIAGGLCHPLGWSAVVA